MYMYINVLVVVSFLLVLSVTSKRGSTNEPEEAVFSSQSSFSLDIEHAFGTSDPAFTHKGTILLKMLKSSWTAKFSKETTLTSDQLQKLEELVRHDGFYLIRAPVKFASVSEDDKDGNKKDGDDSPQRYVSTFVKACHLYGSQLSELITLSVDHVGNVIGISIVSPKHDCILSDVDLHTDQFNSTIQVQQQIAGPLPDTQTFIKKIEKEKADQAAGGKTENKSFLAKYWMYILPVVLIVMLSSQAEPEGNGRRKLKLLICFAYHLMNTLNLWSGAIHKEIL